MPDSTRSRSTAPASWRCRGVWPTTPSPSQGSSKRGTRVG